MANDPLANPLRSLVPQSCQLVIFGAAGDLSWRKLLPAVYNLNVDGALPSHFAVMGFGLPAEGPIEGDPDEYLRNRARVGIQRFSRQPLDEDHWGDFARSLFFVPGSFNDARAYDQLKARLEAVDQQFGIPGSRVFYLAVPPQLVGMCVAHLKSSGLVRDPSELHSFSRVIVEKPIGRDLDSAQQVISTVAQTFDESQTYRIDHYLGKETVQNLLVLRFANSIFEPLWNTKYIDHVQITVAEEEGLVQYDPESGAVTGTRAGYYESVGAMRDMLQNHMLQVLCVVAMEPPWSLAPDVVRDAKSGVLNCLRPMTTHDIEHNVVRGQYIEGDMHGRRVPGYRKEVRDSFASMGKPLPQESVNSTTETFVAMKLFIDNWRWSGVPFYLRTGKRLPKRSSEVAIQFKEVPQVLFNQSPEVPLEPTVLSLRVQPEEGMAMRIASKLPGPKVRIYPVQMEFNYSASLGGTPPEAYERLILDVMAGDATLFLRKDAVEAAWKFVMPIIDHWQMQRVRDLPEYQCGTWGPVEADRIIQPDGRQWRTL
ncbi:MAG: glucose-6-phosphate dehydrogenase [Gemmataceae bacterium]